MPPATAYLPQLSLTAGFLTEAEMCAALILASTTSLKPFLQPFHPGWFVASGHGVTTALTGNPSANNSKQGRSYYELSGVNSSRIGRREAKEEALTSVTPVSGRQRSDNGSDEIDLIQPYETVHLGQDDLRPDGVEHRAIAFASTSPEPGQMPKDRSRWVGVPRSGQQISKTQAWSVSYD
jgi:hypothetical protein